MKSVSKRHYQVGISTDDRQNVVVWLICREQQSRSRTFIEQIRSFQSTVNYIRRCPYPADDTEESWKIEIGMMLPRGLYLLM